MMVQEEYLQVLGKIDARITPRTDLEIAAEAGTGTKWRETGPINAVGSMGRVMAGEERIAERITEVVTAIRPSSRVNRSKYAANAPPKEWLPQAGAPPPNLFRVICPQFFQDRK